MKTFLKHDRILVGNKLYMIDSVTKDIVPWSRYNGPPTGGIDAFVKKEMNGFIWNPSVIGAQAGNTSPMEDSRAQESVGAARGITSPALTFTPPGGVQTDPNRDRSPLSPRMA